MKFRRCPNPLCSRPFQVNRFELAGGSAERGKMTCPHCGLQVRGDGDAVFLTHALSADQEIEFERRDPAASASRETA